MVSLLKHIFFFLNLICSPNSQAVIEHVVRDFVLFFCISLCVCIWGCMAMCLSL